MPREEPEGDCSPPDQVGQAGEGHGPGGIDGQGRAVAAGPQGQPVRLSAVG